MKHQIYSPLTQKLCNLCRILFCLLLHLLLVHKSLIINYRQNIQSRLLLLLLPSSCKVWWGWRWWLFLSLSLSLADMTKTLPNVPSRDIFMISATTSTSATTTKSNPMFEACTWKFLHTFLHTRVDYSIFLIICNNNHPIFLCSSFFWVDSRFLCKHNRSMYVHV